MKETLQTWLPRLIFIASLLTSGVRPDLAASADTEFEGCVVNAVKQNSVSCVSSLVRSAVTKCYLSTDDSDSKALRMIAPDVPFASQLVDASLAYTGSSNLTAVSWTLPSPRIIADVLGADLDGNRSYNAYIVPSNFIGDMVDSLGIAQDLSSLTDDDKDLDWAGFLPFYRDVLSVYGGKVCAIPAQGNMVQLYYRRDLLAAAGLPPPNTWQEVISYATLFNGTDLNGDNTADYGICMWRESCGGASDAFIPVLASLVQSKGSSSGLFFEPESLRSVTDTVAWEAALAITRTLTTLAAPLSMDPPSMYSPCFSQPLFTKGRCAMAMSRAGQFKADSCSANADSAIRGKVGSAQLPGSEFVLNWQDDSLVRCDSDVCPYATQHAIQHSAAFNTAAAQSPERKQGRRHLAQLPAGGSAAAGAPPSSAIIWANRAPYAADGGQSIFISKRQSLPQQLATYYTVVHMVRDGGNWPLVAGPGSEFGPTRKEHLEASSASRWAEYGYHPDDLASFLDATQVSLASKNIAMAFRAVGSLQLKVALHSVSLLVANTSIPLEEVVELSRAIFASLMDDTFMANLQASYKASIRFRTPKVVGATVPFAAPDDSASARFHRSLVMYSVMAAVLGAAALAVTSACLVWHLRRTGKLHRGLRRILAPGVGSSTTICISDIEGSTRLWEMVPDVIMSQSIQLHHECIRRCAVANNGYESAWEGDSVILAFHRAQDAALFCINVQERLMRLPWPEELLEVDICQPLHLADAGVDYLPQHATPAGGGPSRIRACRADAASTKAGGKQLVRATGGMRFTMQAVGVEVAESPLSVASVRQQMTSADVTHGHVSSFSLGIMDAASSVGGSPSECADDQTLDFGQPGNAPSVGFSKASQAPSVGRRNNPGLQACGSKRHTAVSVLITSVRRGMKTARSLTAAGYSDARSQSCNQDPAGSDPTRTSTVRDLFSSAFTSVRPAPLRLCALPSGAEGGGVTPTAPQGPGVIQGSEELLVPGTPQCRSMQSAPGLRCCQPRPPRLAVQQGPSEGTPASRGVRFTATRGSDGVEEPAATASANKVAEDAGPAAGATTVPSGASRRAAGISSATSFRRSSDAHPWRLVLRGLRVRIGCHSGVHAATDVSYSRSMARTTYSGMSMAKARAVVSAAHGGMVLVSGTTHALLTVEAVRAGAPNIVLQSNSRGSHSGPCSIMFWHAGVHELDPNLKQPMELYMVSTPAMAPRWAVLAPPGPAIKAQTIASSVMAAPVGNVCLSVITVTGGASIAAWNLGLWNECTSLLWRQAAASCLQADGYLATTRAGARMPPAQGGSSTKHNKSLLTAVFPTAAAGVRWSAELIAYGLLADWPASLLVHGMADEQLWLLDMPDARQERLAMQPKSGSSSTRPTGQDPNSGLRGNSKLQAAGAASRLAAPTPPLAASEPSQGVEPGLGDGPPNSNINPSTPMMPVPSCSVTGCAPTASLQTSSATGTGVFSDSNMLDTLPASLPVTRPGAESNSHPTQGQHQAQLALPADGAMAGSNLVAAAPTVQGTSGCPEAATSSLSTHDDGKGGSRDAGAAARPASPSQPQPLPCRLWPRLAAAGMSSGGYPAAAVHDAITGSSVWSRSTGTHLPLRFPVREVVRLPGHDTHVVPLIEVPRNLSVLPGGSNVAPAVDTGCTSHVVAQSADGAQRETPGLAKRTIASSSFAALGVRPDAHFPSPHAETNNNDSQPSAAAMRLDGRPQLLLGTAVRPTKLQGPAAQALPQHLTASQAMIFLAERRMEQSSRSDEVDGGFTRDSAPRTSNQLPLALLERLISRGLRLRAGVEMGMASVEVGCVSGEARYIGRTAVAALGLAERAPVSHVLVSSAVMLAAGQAGGTELLADLHPSVASRVKVDCDQ